PLLPISLPGSLLSAPGLVAVARRQGQDAGDQQRRSGKESEADQKIFLLEEIPNPQPILEQAEKDRADSVTERVPRRTSNTLNSHDEERHTKQPGTHNTRLPGTD